MGIYRVVILESEVTIFGQEGDLVSYQLILAQILLIVTK